MRRMTPELWVMVTGLVLLSVGLSVRWGWDVAAMVLGGLLVGLGTWSAAGGDAGGRS